MDLLSHTGDLVAFVRVVETGSFSAAARGSGATPSAVSKSVARLEALLGARLFRRSTRRQSLTADGQGLFDQVAPLLRALAGAADDLHADGPLRGCLRASLPSELGRLLIPAIARDFLPAHPQVTLELSLSDRHVDVVGEGYDVVYRVGMPTDSELRARTLAQLPMVLAAAPSLLREPVTTPAQLTALPFAGYLLHGRVAPLVFADGSVLQPRGPIALDTGAGLRAAALQGLGVVHLMRCTVQAELDRGELVDVWPDAPLPRLPLQAMHALGRHVPTRARMFTEFVARQVAGLE